MHGQVTVPRGVQGGPHGAGGSREEVLRGQLQALAGGALRPRVRRGRVVGGGWGEGLGKAEKQEHTQGVESGEEAGMAEWQ